MDIKKLEKYLDNTETVNESEDGVMGYEHPHGGRGRQGHNKGIVCPFCNKTIDLRKVDMK